MMRPIQVTCWKIVYWRFYKKVSVGIRGFNGGIRAADEFLAATEDDED